jgi:hypothetical protein
MGDMAKKTKEKIIDVVQKMFAQKGYEGRSVDLIAVKAKVNKASLYENMFSKKISVVFYSELFRLLTGRIRQLKSWKRLPVLMLKTLSVKKQWRPWC